MESRKEPNPSSFSTPSNLKLAGMDARAPSEAIVYGNTNKSKFVTHKKRAGRKKFQGVRRKNGKWLGTFSCPKMAAPAHDVTGWSFRGEFAGLNFPDSACLSPRPRSITVKDTQVGAEIIGEEVDQDRPSDDHDGGDLEVVFWDEEEVFNMPALLNGMAEGLILTPPALKKGFKWHDFEGDNVDLELDFTLWSN